MQPKQEKRHIVDILFVLALFAVFALSALILVVLGANIYKSTVSSMSRNFEARTACSYISEKVRQNDVYDSIYIDKLEGCEALVFSKDVYGSVYATYIYFHDGELKELFMRVGSNIGSAPLEAGTSIMELLDFHLEYVNNNLLAITLVTAEGETKTVYTALHSGTKEVAQ